MIRIISHARGIAICPTEGADRNTDTLRLGEMLADRAYVSGGRLVAPLDAAAEVLEVLPASVASWDNDILEYATKQSIDRASQLRARLEVAGALETPLEAVADYPRTRLLDRHQVDAVAVLTIPSLRGVALFDEQGTGKTIAALAAFDLLRLRGRVRKLIVIAPKSVLVSWHEQTTQFLGHRTRVSLVAGTATSRRRAVRRSHDVLLVGYESAVQEEPLLRTIIAAEPNTYMLVIDESYFVKNPETIRAQSVTRLREYCERAIVLCGTPAPNSPADVVNQIDIADRGIAFGGRRMSNDRDVAIQEVKNGLANAVVIRRLKEDVLPHLTAKQTIKTYLDLAPIQRDLYERSRRDLSRAVLTVSEEQFRKSLTSFLAQRLRLLQICSNPRAVDPLYDEVPAKLDALDQVLRELVEHRGLKVVVWSHFRVSLDAIAERYARYGCVRIDGSVKSLDARARAIDSFQGDPNIRMFLGNAGAAGAGITLTAAHHAIYESFSNQAAHYMQSVDRIHRRGQTNDVVSHVLIARDTLEEREFARLMEKERAGRQLLGDDYSEPMTRERFLVDIDHL